MSDSIDRRTFLMRGALGVAGITVLPSILAACGSSSKKSVTSATTALTGSKSATKDLGTLAYQFSW